MIITARVTIEKIQELRDAGLKYKQIAERLGTTENYVRRVVYESKHPEAKEKDKRRANRQYNKREQGITIPSTEMVITGNPETIENVVGKIGDDKVNAFITYHLDMMKMRMGVDKRDVPGLYKRFIVYLQYCAEHNIIPNNMNAYFAIGLNRQEVSSWYTGKSGTPEHRQFAEDIKSFFSSIHEQGAIDGLINPILSIFWSKAYDNLSDQPQKENIEVDPLGEKQSADSIAAKWSEVDLPSD